MRIGLLWYDSDTRKSAERKIEEAAARYREKFRVFPNTCHVHPSVVASHPRLSVVANRWIRPDFFWVGVDDDAKPAARGRREGGSRQSVDKIA